ncbi:uncharacterized protein L203_101212 [Cryptococcus depauperatus CBS 7841]|uniref:Uncharacterized protein n=1 Tax=Cryptococcus depauperatus CBS 7841 TaxID=1295531 RepID=A0AAJ8JPJ4_9TREE
MSSKSLTMQGQTAHWFEQVKVWPQFIRIPKLGGTVAYISYAVLVFPQDNCNLSPLDTPKTYLALFCPKL